MAQFRDDQGRTLEEYPRPSVAVDTAVLSPVLGGTLHLLIVHPGDEAWRLPGSILRPRERLAEAVARALRVKAGLGDRSPQQLHVFDHPERDQRGWVLSVAHVDVLPEGTVSPVASPAPNTQGYSRVLVPLDDVMAGTIALRPEQQDIVEYAVDHVRSRHRNVPDPFGLLDGEFTLRQLRLLHESVAGEELQPDTFRRTMEPLLEPTGNVRSEGRGRPARTFRSVRNST